MKKFATTAFLFLITFFSKSFANERNKPLAAASFRSNLYIVGSGNSLTLADGNLAQYDNSFSATLNSQDIIKQPNLNETFGILLDNALLAIERKPMIVAPDTLFFSLTKTTQQNYQFQFTTTALNEPGLSGTLIDSYTGISTPVDLNGSTSVNFSVDANAASQVANRFMVVFENSTVTPVTFTSVSAWQNGENTEVSWDVMNQLNIKQYDIERSTDGISFTQVGSVTVTNNNPVSKYAWNDVTAPGNYFYRIESVGTDGSVLYSQIVKLKTGMATNSITVYPNPVHDDVVGLQFNNMPQGAYSVRVISLSGQEVAKSVLNNSGESSVNMMPLGKNINRGIYQLEIIGPNNNKTVLKILNY